MCLVNDSYIAILMLTTAYNTISFILKYIIYVRLLVILLIYHYYHIDNNLTPVEMSTISD